MFSAHLDFAASAAALAVAPSSAQKSPSLHQTTSSKNDKDTAMDHQIPRSRADTNKSAATQEYPLQISPATGQEIHPRENSGLKYLTVEQHAKFWEATLHYKDMFSEAKWQAALQKIDRVKKEAVLTVLGYQMPPRIYHSFGAPGGHQLRLRSSSALTAPTGAHPLRPAELPRIESTSSHTPRPRWDVVTPGPVTPLSATPGSKKGNAFAEGGFWANLTPKTPVIAVPIPATPISAVPIEPWIPAVPTDPEAKAVYDEVHEEVRTLSLKLCASRLTLTSSTTSEYDLIHPSMVKPKDELLAAEFTLESCQLNLSQHIDPSLPEKVEKFADEEAASLRTYSIPTADGLRDIDTWLNFDEKTGDLTTILEAQRDMLRMKRDRRKNESLRLTDQAVRLAWATKVVEDKKYTAEGASSDSDSEEDEGYDYSNFVRSIRSVSSRESLDDRSSTSTLLLRSRNAKNLSISTIPPPPAHALRRQGPSTSDLASWASELRNMEHKRAEQTLSLHGSVNEVVHPAFRGGNGEGTALTRSAPPRGRRLTRSADEEYAGGLPPPPRPVPTSSGYNRQAATSWERRASGLRVRPVTGYNGSSPSSPTAEN
jgi:hypothetical protein